MTDHTPPEVRHPIKRALLSVSDKTGIVKFARALQERGIEILSTGGTAKLLQAERIPVIEVADVTGFPEMMSGRVKTLHPKIHGGLLGRRGIDDEVMRHHNIAAIDLLVVNLYPFQQVTAKPDCTLQDAIENIDIGGPAMLRSAAKNHAAVSVVVDPQDYARLLAAMDADNAVDAALRFDLAIKAFEHSAAYDGAIANYFGKLTTEKTQIFPRTLNLQLHKMQDMRYGENPHQHAALYRDTEQASASIVTAAQLQGKALSYNNVADADAALECVKQFQQPACVIVKHANPCGVALGDSIAEAYQRAYQTDPTSAFGGIIAFNRMLDADTAQQIIEQQFVEVIIAPKVSSEALAVCQRKQNVRLLECGDWAQTLENYDYKRVYGGLLVQTRDMAMIETQQLKVVSRRLPSEYELEDLLFAWQVAKFVKSNAIVYCKNKQTIGIGAGQMSRVYSARIAGIKATDEGLQVADSVMASDAFFPFRDGIDAAHAAGIRAVIQPGGSVRDEEVIQAANEHNIAMVFTGMRHFRH